MSAFVVWQNVCVSRENCDVCRLGVDDEPQIRVIWPSRASQEHPCGKPTRPKRGQRRDRDQNRGPGQNGETYQRLTLGGLSNAMQYLH
jgi:hypothetical protein